MILNILGILVLGGLVYYAVSASQSTPVSSFVSQSVSKSRSFVNKNKDSSMYTELLRRQAIQRVGRVKPGTIKETKTQFGSLTGYLETFIITGIASFRIEPSQPCPKDILYDGGDQFGEYCPIPGSSTLDGGIQGTATCESCPPDILFDGGNHQSSNFKSIIGSGNLDGGNQGTATCESCAQDILFDGGNQTSDFKSIIGSGNLDGGNPDTMIVCRICQRDIIYDGGQQNDEFCPIPGNDNLDGGNQNTRVCGQ